MSEWKGRTMAAGWAVLLVLLSICLVCVEGGVFASLDPCPDGVAPGETWYPDVIPGSDGTPAECMSCTCFEDMQGYQCRSCGAYSIPYAGEGCYVAKVDPEGLYPECCAVEVLCPGDDGYNADNTSANVSFTV